MVVMVVKIKIVRRLVREITIIDYDATVHTVHCTVVQRRVSHIADIL